MSAEKDETSPCGLVRVEWQFSTGLMSHEINSPRFIDARTGEPFLTLWDEQWDASVRWAGEGRFGFSLRNYGRSGNVEAEVDLPARTFRVIDPTGKVEPLDNLDRSIRAAFKQVSSEATAVARVVDPPRKTGNIGIAFIAIFAIALGAAWLSFH